MANERLTEWYGANQNPAHDGVYERQLDGIEWACFAKYSTLHNAWSLDCTSVLIAAAQAEYFRSLPRWPWRGMHHRSK
jgi:hypothetical protein